MSNYLLWDFDGTLGWRIDGLQGRAWSSSMLEAIIHLYPENSKILIDDITPHLRYGFPWHEPDMAHTHLNSSELWWKHIRKVMSDAYMKLAFTEQQANELSVEAQNRFVDLSTWELYEDTIPVLSSLQTHGWNHIIVSNHVPELELIINHLGLGAYVEEIINSAIIGYEKPNPEIYKQALVKAAGSKNIWMIGDNIHADILGAEAAGINAILVRNADERAKNQFDHLYDLQKFLMHIE
ncbi:HAD family hydrolase [Paenibacillus piri]|uniref:HAD family hydrolase n=1 Tax=Paenibacillus piri TaxID=2547395 RepID=A0A4R5KIE3_9BACL|nr:HAD-IA family hydrolase [Paenibacillus piri]TDF95156.1 HAD family hydrolase [Paenibacillus piri]